MKTWLDRAAELTQLRVPRMSIEHAKEIAEDLYASWPDDEPEVAVAKFFHGVGSQWMQLNDRPH